MDALTPLSSALMNAKDNDIHGIAASGDWGWCARESILEVVDFQNGQSLFALDFASGASTSGTSSLRIAGDIVQVVELTHSAIPFKRALAVCINTGLRNSTIAVLNPASQSCTMAVTLSRGLSIMQAIPSTIFQTKEWEAAGAFHLVAGTNSGEVFFINLLQHLKEGQVCHLPAEAMKELGS